MTRLEARGRGPSALCGLVLAAAAFVLFPRWAEPIVRPARWLMCLPLRVLPEHTASAAASAATTFVDRAALSRLDAEACREGSARMPAEHVAVPCRVLERRAVGAARLPSLLVLDRTWAEVEGCDAVVTRGGALVGFLGRPGDLAEGSDGRLAVVRCVHANVAREPPRRVVAATAIAGQPMRLVAEPGSRIDAWPLRVALLEDPYLAARLVGAGGRVHTCGAGDRGGEVPDGLELGALRVWGYTDDAGAVLPVGYFVELAFDPEAITTVALWRPAAERPQAALPEPVFRIVRAAALPPAGERLYLVHEGGRLALGAAAVDAHGSLYGVVAEAGPGDAVAESFATAQRTWSLLLVPDGGGAPLECSARVQASWSAHVELELTAPTAALTGAVLTGANGLHCPAGLRVGRIAWSAAGGKRLVVARPVLDLATVSVCARGGGAP